MGLQAILIEQEDFAWGTSSRSSKLVHGGLRYIKEGHLLLTKISVEERDRLLAEAPGLVEPLGFMLPVYEEQKPGKKLLKVGLTIYDIMARERQHRFLKPDELLEKLPFINPVGLVGGFHYHDAQVDDSRLVLRLIKESVDTGAQALNYTRVTRIIRSSAGKVFGIDIAEEQRRHHRQDEVDQQEGQKDADRGAQSPAHPDDQMVEVGYETQDPEESEEATEPENEDKGELAEVEEGAEQGR